MVSLGDRSQLEDEREKKVKDDSKTSSLNPHDWKNNDMYEKYSAVKT